LNEARVTADLNAIASRPWARGLMALVLVAALILLARLAWADGVELTQISTQRTEEGLDLSYGTRFELPHAAEDSLLKGIAVYFTAETTVVRSRWYWRDARVAHASRTWRVQLVPLTRQFKVTIGAFSQNFGTLTEALSSMRGAANWRIAEPKDIEDSGSYYLEFSFRLDTSQLPKPMQIGLGAPQGWGLSIERTLSLNPDFSVHTGSP
jgi:hypothetical protein